MRKVVFFTGQSMEVAERFQQFCPPGFDVGIYSDQLPKKEKIALIQDAEYLVLHPAEISAAVLREARQLRLIQLLSAGYDKLDLALVHTLGALTANNGGANAVAVAEHAVALLLGLYKKLVACDASVRAGTWRQVLNGFNTYEIAGKTVGILGAGRIGCRVAQRLKAFETEILYYNPSSVQTMEETFGAKKVELDEILRRSDILSLHMPLLPETQMLLDGDKFAMMKKKAVLINTSRAEIVDEQALFEALSQKRILGAGLDVFHQEPIAADNPLLRLDNVVLSPHSAGHSYEGWDRRFSMAWENIQRVEKGEAPYFLLQA